MAPFNERITQVRHGDRREGQPTRFLVAVVRVDNDGPSFSALLIFL